MWLWNIPANLYLLFRQLEENLLETACLLPEDQVAVLRTYLKLCRRYNPLVIFNIAMTNGKLRYGRFLIDEMRLKFGGAAGRFTFEVNSAIILLLSTILKSVKYAVFVLDNWQGCSADAELG